MIVGEIPCAPRRVLENVCQQCHTTPRRNGAPFALITYSDVKSTIDDRPITFWMEAAVNTGKMPLPPVDLADNDRETLLAWLRAGAPSRGPQDSCDAGTPADAGADASDDTSDDTGLEDDAGASSETEPTD